MTVETNDTVERYTISGTGPYAFSFRIFSESDLAVKVLDADGLPTTLVLDTHYTVPDASINDEDGGTLSLITATATAYAGLTLDIRSNTPIEQPTDLENQGAFRLRAIESVLDRQSRQLQDVRRLVKNSLRLQDISTTDAELSPIANWLERYVYINAEGIPEPASAISLTTLTQSILAQLLFPQTDAEDAAGVTPTNHAYRYSPERYGAVGDGVTDDTTALQAWASVGDVRDGSEKTFKCNDKITFAKDAVLRGPGSNKFVIDFTGATGTFTGNRCVEFAAGTFIAKPDLSGDVAKGATVLPFVGAHGLVQGDIIRIHNPTASSWSAFNADYTAGEYAVVAEVLSSTSVGLSAPLYSAYTAALVDITKFDYATVNMSGVRFKGIGNTSIITTLFMNGIANSHLQDVVVESGGDRAFDLRHAFNVRVDAKSYHYFSATPGSAQYGLVITHCQDIEVMGSYQGERHAVVTGAAGGGVVNRNIKLSGVTAKSLIDCALDFHGNTEYSAMENCFANGGIAMGGDNNACRNSSAIGYATIHEGQPFRFREMLGCNFQLSGLQLFTDADPHSDGGVGVIDIGGNVSTTMTADTIRSGVIQLSTIVVTAPNANAGIRFVNRGSTAECHIDISNVNLRIDSGADVAFGLIRLDAISGDNFQSYCAHGLRGPEGLVRSKINFDVDHIEYEEEVGNFTPGVSFGGAITGITYTHQIGRYQLIGNEFFWEVNILLSSKGSSTGNAAITGLLFAVGNITDYAPACVVQGSGMTFADVLHGVLGANATTVLLQEVTNAGVLTSITDADFTNTTRIRASGHYRRAY